MGEDCEDAFAAMIENDGYVLFDYDKSDLFGLTAAEIEKEFEDLKAYKEMWEELEECQPNETMSKIKEQYFPEGD